MCENRHLSCMTFKHDPNIKKKKLNKINHSMIFNSITWELFTIDVECIPNPRDRRPFMGPRSRGPRLHSVPLPCSEPEPLWATSRVVGWANINSGINGLVEKMVGKSFRETHGTSLRQNVPKGRLPDFHESGNGAAWKFKPSTGTTGIHQDMFSMNGTEHEYEKAGNENKRT